jgi:hypothetical protein
VFADHRAVGPDESLEITLLADDACSNTAADRLAGPRATADPAMLPGPDPGRFRRWHLMSSRAGSLGPADGWPTRSGFTGYLQLNVAACWFKIQG